MHILSPKISIVILHYENPPMLMECLESCRRITYPNYDIYIVKNGPEPQFDLSAIRSYHSDISDTIFSTENGGYAYGNNLGMRQALQNGADYILLLNDDTIVAPNFIDILVEEGEKSPGIGILGPKIYYANEPKKIWFAGSQFDPKTCKLSDLSADEFDPGIDEEPFDSGYITGCAFMIKKKVVDKIGLLDERFFLYWEDVDWAIRAQNKGFRNILVPDSHIWHKVSVSIGGTESPLKTYHKTRSHLLFANLHTPWAIGKLRRRFLRDIAWLFIKSKDGNRFKKAYAFIAAIMDYQLGRTDKGPDRLWNK